MIQPLGDNILVELITQPSQTSTGILLTENAKQIRVKAVSANIKSVKPGDTIELTDNSITTIGEWMFVKEKDVIAIRGNA